MNIWGAVSGEKYITPMMATIHRVVEDQENAATVALVNNMEEQGVLEELLEKSKPKRPEGYEDLHYLLTTPFRYPPLLYGSRFGSTFEPSIFYGSLNVSTALCETAYYQFVFMSGMDIPFSEAREVSFSSFSVSIRTNKGIYLDREPFNQYDELITSKDNFVSTQKLGSSMRNANIEAFQYVSARDPERGKNVGLYTPAAFQKSKPINYIRWISKITNEAVGFLSNDNHERISFDKSLFLLNGTLPTPAC